MDASKCQERAAARFEKVLRLYWDGLPTLPFVTSNQDNLLRTFKLRQLNYSPDYNGEVVELSLAQDALEFKGFLPLCQWESKKGSISCRIGSHYSPYVGLFKFYKRKELHGVNLLDEEHSSRDHKRVIRIPKDLCELPQDWDDTCRWNYRKFVRTSKLFDLYYPVVKEFCPIPVPSLRRIIRLGTRGVPPNHKESVVREIQVLKDDYTRWVCECAFYYMSIDRLFWKILSPLQLIRCPPPVPYIIMTLPPEERMESKGKFLKARNSLQESIVWRSDTQNYLLSLRILWNTRFKRLVYFDITMKEWITDADTFGRQLKASLQIAFSRIRIEFYSYIEEFFFTYVSNARKSLFLSEEELSSSVFHRIFIATRLFLIDRVRNGLFEGLDKVVDFIGCFRNFRCTCQSSKRIAEKYPLIGINLVVSHGSVPRSTDFSLLVTVVRSLFDDIRSKCKELPRVEYIFFPTLNFKKVPLNFITEIEIAGYRSGMMEILDEVSTKIDSISKAYGEYSIFPSKDESIARGGDEAEIKEHICWLRDKYYGVLRVTPDVVYCGRFAINCKWTKDHYSKKWEEFLLKFYAELHKAADFIIQRVEEKCLQAQKAMQKVPLTVSDLEQYVIECASAKVLGETLHDGDCQDIIKRIQCMEDCQVPIDNKLYYSAEKMMKWPQILEQDLRNAEVIKEKAKPSLRDHVDTARRETRDHINTLSTGIIELYNMFNLEICDIAAQTCIELGYLVTEILNSIEEIHHQEKALEIVSVDSFEDIYPLLNYFETIDQFWMTIYRSQALKEYYASPIHALSGKMIESVREWRRLIHSATRSLRGYPPLVRLGQQQEVILSKFEALEEFINLASTPGLRKQHWKEIGRVLYSKLHDDVNLVTDMSITLQRLLDADALRYLLEIKRIVGEASSDFHAESILEQMKSSSKKIRFRVETVSISPLTTRLHVPSIVHSEILSQIESYLKTCRDLRGKSPLSGAIMKALNEWEGSTEKMREMLIQWKKIEDQWVPFENFYVTAEKAQKKERKQEMVSILECLIRAHDAFHQLYLKIGKPQFSLYMAIVQETVMEHLTTVKTAVAELRSMLGGICEKKRGMFPRFYFVTDDQLVTYFSAYNIDQLKSLLPFMYPRLRNVEIEDNYVVAFTTDSGFTIKADPPFAVEDSLEKEWMSTFDTILSNSVFTAITECCSDFGKNVLEKWIDNHCPQMLMMGLRVAHTKRMRESISFSRDKGLLAYQLQLKHIKGELCRICSSSTCSKRSRDVIVGVLSYLFNVEVDVATALDQHISNLSELDGTSMIQTFLNEETTTTRILGVDFLNGAEFYGEYGFNVVMTPEIVERVVILFLLMLLGKVSPWVSGENRTFLPHAVVSFTGRYCIPIQFFSKISLESVLAYCRGAIQIGAILCFHDADLMDPEIHARLREIFSKVSRVSSLKNRKKGECSTTHLPVGPGETIVPVKVNPYFSAMFTCGDIDSLPLAFKIESRPIYMPPADCVAIIRGTLYCQGLTDEFTTSLLFGSFFELFHCIRPKQFSMGCLTHIVRLVGSHPRQGSVIERLCESFVRFYFLTLQDDLAIRDLFLTSLTDVLGIEPTSSFFQNILKKIRAVERQHSHEFFSRFADLMITNRKVLISGPPFSGKTNAWKKWVGNSPYYIFSPSFMSVSDFFGPDGSSGIYSAIEEKYSSENHRYVIVEGGSELHQSFLDRIEDYAHVFVEENGFIEKKSFFIVTTRRLHHLSPGSLGGFSQFNLNVMLTWILLLKKSLMRAPHSELVIEIMEIVLGALFDGLKNETTNLLSSLYLQKEYQLAATMRCTEIYKKWYDHAKQRVEQSTFVSEGKIDERGFAVQCAVFACVWGIGLALPIEDRGTITRALHSCEKAVEYIVESYDITVSAFPSFSNSKRNNIFYLIPTVYGWESHENAQECGFLYPWSSHVHLNPQQPTSFQVFEMPSRLHLVQAAESLVRCGVNIVFCGGESSGRTTLLNTTRYCDQWSSCYIGCSKGIQANSICGKISSRLSRRSNGVFGPVIGRPLTVCIDDLHLSNMVEENLTVAGNVIGFCTKFKHLICSSSGSVPVTDVQFCSASNLQKLSSIVSRACTEIYLPPLNGDELAGGLWELFESCCAKRRVEGLPRQTAAFMAIAHSFYIRTLRSLRFPKRSLYISGYDILLTSSLELFSDRFRIAMRASEVVRFSLLSPMPDIQVVGTTFRFVDELYSAMLLAVAPDTIGSFREHLRKLANITLGLCTPENTFANNQVIKEVPFSTTTTATQETVRGWISSLEDSVDLQKTRVLETLMTKGQLSSLPHIDPEYGNSSVLISYPSGLSSSGKGITHLVRQGSMRVIPGSRQPNRKQSHGEPLGYLSRTYPTTWLETHANFLLKAFRHDEFHFIFIGTETFGLERLVRLVCHAGGMSLALFRNSGLEFTKNIFLKELRACIFSALLHDSVTVIYLPFSVLQVDGVFFLIDSIIRSGDVSELFSTDELTALAKGYSITQRSLRELNAAESLELRRRVQYLLHFVLQFHTLYHVAHYRKGYPCLKNFFSLSLHLPQSSSQFRHEMVVKLLGDKDPSISTENHESIEKKLGTNEEMARLICLMYDTVRKEVPTRLEQLVEFSRLVRKFRLGILKKTQFDMRMKTMMSANGVDGRKHRMGMAENTMKSAEVQKERAELDAELQNDKIAILALEKSLSLIKMRLHAEEEESRQMKLLKEEQETGKKRALRAAGNVLQNAKGLDIRKFSQCRPPLKGSLLVNAVLCTLGKRAPENIKNNPTELWNFGLKIMCKKGFAESLKEIHPNTIENPAALLEVKTDLDELHFTGSLKYGQLIVQYIIALTNMLHTNEDAGDSLSAAKEELLIEFELVSSQLQAAEQLQTHHLEKRGNLDDLEDELKRESQKLVKRGVVMGGISTVVDRFVEFVENNDEPHTEIVEGDILMVSALFSLILMHRDVESLYQKLQSAAFGKGVSTSLQWEKTAQELLFVSQSLPFEYVVPNHFPPFHRAVLYGILGGLYSRWPLIGGVTEMFEETLKEFLSFESRKCRIVSAYDPSLYPSLLEALKDGSGLIVRDVIGEWAADQLRPLHQILSRIHEIREGNGGTIPPQTTFKVIAYGKEVEVDARFFLVGTSATFISCENNNYFSEWFNVVNLYGMVAQGHRYEWLLSSAPSVKSIQDDIINKRHLVCDEFLSLMRCYRVVTDFIAGEKAEEDPFSLRVFKESLDDLIRHHTLLNHYQHQFTVTKGQHVEMWHSSMKVIERCAENLQFIEYHKLSRPWCDAMLDEHIRGMCCLAPQLVSRLAPRVFMDIPLPERHFYAQVNFLGSLLRSFVMGWPSYLRGFFSLLLVSDIISLCSDIKEQRGVLFSDKLPLLNDEQVSTLRAFLSDDTLCVYKTHESDEEDFSRHLRESLRKHYLNSKDPLLSSLASEEENSLDDDEALVENFFIHVLNLEFDQAGNVGEELVNGFFMCVLDSKRVSGEDEAFATENQHQEDEVSVDRPSTVQERSETPISSPRNKSDGGFSTEDDKKVGSPLRSRSHCGSSWRGVSVLSNSLSTRGEATKQGKADEKTNLNVPTLGTSIHALELAAQSSAFCIPWCITVALNEESSILLQIRQFSHLIGWEFVWLVVSSTEIIRSVSHRLMQLFYRSSTNMNTLSLVLYVDLPAHLLVPSFMLSPAQRAELVAFKEEIGRITHTLHGQRRFSTEKIFKSSTGAPPLWKSFNLPAKKAVNIVFVMSVEAHHVLWGNCEAHQHPLPILRCVYFFPLFFTPQQHLRTLLRTASYVQKNLSQTLPSLRLTEQEGMGGRGTAPYLRRESSVATLKTTGATRGNHSIGGVVTTEGGLSSGSEGPRRNSLGFAREWVLNTFVELRKKSLLAAKELLIVHVAMSQRLRMTQFNWLSHHHFLCPSRYGKSQSVNDENLTLLLMLLQGWVEWSEFVVQEVEETLTGEEESDIAVGVQPSDVASQGGSAVLTNPPGSGSSVARKRSSTVVLPSSSALFPSTASHLRLNGQDMERDVSAIFGLGKNRERYAYLFYRQQLRYLHWESAKDWAVDHGYGAMSSTRSPHPIMSKDDSSPFGVSPGKMNTLMMSHYYSSVISATESGQPKLSLGIFNALQKMTFAMLSSSGLCCGDIKGLQFILDKVVVSPSSSQVVTCDYTRVHPRCPLLLDQEVKLADFLSEVEEMRSDLVELCGDAFATTTFRRAVDHRLRDFLFYYSDGEKERSRAASLRQSIVGGLRAFNSSGSCSSTDSAPIQKEEQEDTTLADTVRSMVIVPRSPMSSISVSRGSGALQGRKKFPTNGGSRDSRLRRSAPIVVVPGDLRHRMPRVCRHNSDEQAFGSLNAVHPTVRISHWNLLFRESYVSSHDLAPLTTVRTYCTPWLECEEGKLSTPQPWTATSGRMTPPLLSSEKMAWELERPHALQLLQFYFSPRSPMKFHLERERLMRTYEMLATMNAIQACDSVQSCWICALANPSVTLRLLTTAVHAKLSARVRPPTPKREEEGRSEKKGKEPAVKCIVIVVTLRSLLCAGDVILSGAYFSGSLQANIQKVTGWKKEWFPRPFSLSKEDPLSVDEKTGQKSYHSPLNERTSLWDPLMISSDRFCSREPVVFCNADAHEDEEVVVVVRMTEKRGPPSEQTVVFLETPLTGHSKEGTAIFPDIHASFKEGEVEVPTSACTRPREGVVPHASHVEEARAYTWQLPPRNVESTGRRRSLSFNGSTNGFFFSKSRRSSTTDTNPRMGSDFSSPASPTFFTSVPLSPYAQGKRGLGNTTYAGKEGGETRSSGVRASSRHPHLRYLMSSTPVDVLYESRVLRERKLRSVKDDEVFAATVREKNRKTTSESGTSTPSSATGGSQGIRTPTSRRQTAGIGVLQALGVEGDAVDRGDGTPSPTSPKKGGLFLMEIAEDGPISSSRDEGIPQPKDSREKADVVMSCPTPTAAALFTPSSLGIVPPKSFSSSSSAGAFYPDSAFSPEKEIGKTSVYYVDTAWESMGPDAFCVVWESDENEETLSKGLEVPLGGLAEYYIYVR